MGKSKRRLSAVLASLAAGGGLIWLSTGLPDSDQGAKPPASRTASAPAAAPAKNDAAHESIMLNAALEKKPGHGPVLMRLAQLSIEKGDRAQAVKYLREAVQNEPENADARLELGKALFENGDSRDALAETEAILARQPSHRGALYNLGAIHANLGQAGLARQYWQKLIASHSSSDEAKRAQGMLAALTPQSN